MTTPLVILLDVLAADAAAPPEGFESTFRDAGDGSGALSVLDAGAARGDGVFETLAVVNGRAQSIGAHVQRLAASAALLDLPAPNPAQWRAAIESVAGSLAQDGQCSMKLVLTRGVDGSASGAPTAWIAATASASTFPERERGVRIVLLERGYSSDVQERAPWLLAGAKTLSYAINMAAIREAKRRGADDALFVSSDGYVLEGPTSTVIARIGGVYTTPPARAGVLPGTTQLALFDHLERSGAATAYRMIRPGELQQADGIWLVSSLRLVAEVRELEGAQRQLHPPLTRAFNAALLAREA